MAAALPRAAQTKHLCQEQDSGAAGVRLNPPIPK